MDGSDAVEPVATLGRLLSKAHRENARRLCVRPFLQGGRRHSRRTSQSGIEERLHSSPGDDSNDHNDVWQDGAVMINVGEPE